MILIYKILRGLLLVTPFFFQGCAYRLWYVNDPVVFGNVKKQGDLNVSGGKNTGAYTRGKHLQCSYATSDNHFIIASYTDYSVAAGNTHSTRGRSFLGGFGYYRPVGKNLFLEFSGGARYAENNNTPALNTGLIKHTKLFIQPALTFTSRYFELGLGARAGLIYFLPAEKQALPTDQNTSVRRRFVDPAISVAFGIAHLKVGAQLSVSFLDNPFLYSGKNSVYESDPVAFTFFVRFKVPSKKSAKKQPLRDFIRKF
jgi:hypothetical protein